MFRKKLKIGELDDTIIELEVADTSNPMGEMDIPGQPGQGQMMNLGDMFGKAFGGRTVKQALTVADSYELLIGEEADKLLDDETVNRPRSRRSNRTASCSWTKSTRSAPAPMRAAASVAAKGCSATCCR